MTSRRKTVLILAGTAFAVLVYLLGKWLPFLGVLGAPGFLVSLLLFSRGLEFGQAFLVGGIIFNAVFYSSLLIGLDKMRNWVHSR